MKKIVEYIIAYLLRFTLWFRYRIRVEGLEKLTPETLKRSGGVLFLPNHPTYFIDPIVATLSVWPKFPIRPMIVEYMYYTPIVHGLMRFMDALPIPNFVNSSNSLKRKKSEKVIQTVIEELKTGTNFLVYPAGKVKHTAYEAVGGASAVQRILHEVPEANVVLMRMKGLWGSRFSRALTNEAPVLSKVLWEAFKVILTNLIFFTPRREIIIELQPAGPDFPRNASRLELNKYLESWYNRPDGLTKQEGKLPGDSLVLVSYSMWGEKYMPVREITHHQEEEISLASIPKDIQEKVIRKIAELKDCPVSQIKPEMSLASDLGLDSLDGAELTAFLQDQFDVYGVSGNQLTTVGKLMALASGNIEKRAEPKADVADRSKWVYSGDRHKIEIAPGKTIAEAFLNQCNRSGNAVACVDGRLGVQTFSKLKLRAILLADALRRLPGEYIGIMLPASIAANLLILACELAGKIPVMVNWTIGPRHLESVVDMTHVEVVISSWAFLDRLDNVNLDGIDEKLLMLEDIVRKITIFDKLKALYRSKLSTHAVLKAFGVDKTDDGAQAVLLFTSGTENLPKGVPLTHFNILNNLRSAVGAIGLYSDDIIFAILPPFHSFGLVCGIIGSITGLRIAYSPDPTDGSKLIEEFARWGATLMVGPPTFVKGMLKSAKPEQIKTMRICLTGAEKTPPELIQMLDNLGKPNCLMECYGITECSPGLTFNPPGSGYAGVGQPFPGIELGIVHPETEKILPTGERGLIIAKGPNIFGGYLNPGAASPFLIINGEKWYKTGDLGYLDEKGSLTISGRMKRFIKIGGEMVSLASIEDALLQMAQKKGWPTVHEGPALAICARETPGEKSKIFLFNTFDTTIDEINGALKESGFSNLVKVSAVKKVLEIPVMGTGKTNYRLLESEFLGNG